MAAPESEVRIGSNSLQFRCSTSPTAYYSAHLGAARSSRANLLSEKTQPSANVSFRNALNQFPKVPMAAALEPK